VCKKYPFLPLNRQIKCRFSQILPSLPADPVKCPHFAPWFSSCPSPWWWHRHTHNIYICRLIIFARIFARVASSPHVHTITPKRERDATRRKWMRISGSFHTSRIFAPVVLIVPADGLPKIGVKFICFLYAFSFVVLLPVLMVTRRRDHGRSCPRSARRPEWYRPTVGRPEEHQKTIYRTRYLFGRSPGWCQQEQQKQSRKTRRRQDKQRRRQDRRNTNLYRMRYCLMILFCVKIVLNDIILILFWYDFLSTVRRSLYRMRYKTEDSTGFVDVCWRAFSAARPESRQRWGSIDNNQDDKKRLQNVQLFI